MNEDTVGLERFFDQRMTKMEESFQQQIESLNLRMEDHFIDCKELCRTRLSSVSSATDKAHIRLDRQKEAIECLTAHKNKEIGYRKAFGSIMVVFGLIISYLGLKSSN